MAKLTVSLAGVDYDRTRALFDGSVGIEGCEAIACAMNDGLDANRAALDAVTRYAPEQHLTARRLEPSELFVPSTLSLAKVWRR